MKIILSKDNHDTFLTARFISGGFLQSSLWHKFLKKQGHNTWQIVAVDDNEVVGLCLLYENKLPMSRSYFYAPKGPIISRDLKDDKRIEVLQLMLSKARDLTIDTKLAQEIFFKLEPTDEMMVLPELVKSPDVQPRDNLIIDLKKDTKELLADMHAKTRYNIALSRRKGVKVRFSHDSKDIKHFLDLIKNTATRNQITLLPDAHYELLFEVLTKEHAGELALAEVDGKVVAANMLIRFGKATTYLHGGTDYELRKYMAPHLLQWESIKRAKEHGYTKYDLGGIAPEDGSKPRWAGLTRFKKGFGGYGVKSPGAYDLIYDKSWYSLYKLSKKILRK